MKHKTNKKPSNLANKMPVRAVFRNDKPPRQKCRQKNFLRLIASFKPHSFIKSIQNLIKNNAQHTKKVVQLSLFVILIALPVKRLIINQYNAHQQELIKSIAHKHVLTVAATENSSIIHNKQGLFHGFGYDVVRQYAKKLGVQLAFVTYPTADATLMALDDNDVDIALIDYPINSSKYIFSPLLCDEKQYEHLKQSGLENNLTFVINKQNPDLQQDINSFLCSPDTKNNIKYLAKFHDNTLLKNTYNYEHFVKSLKKLPVFEYSFRISAKQFYHDWQLLAMIGYQESHLNADAVSFTGVKGMMMLTQNTAQAMGVKDRTDVHQSIWGGAKYLNKLQKQFENIPAEDRLWFVLASYNMGPNAIKDIQEKLKNKNKDPNLWLNVYQYLIENNHENRRYAQCVKYVTNIRNYLEEIKSYKA